MLASAPQSPLRFPFTRLLGNAGQVRVLRVLGRAPAPVGVSQLAAEAGLTPQGTRMVLAALAAHRLVQTFGAGRARLYAIEPSHPLAAALAELFRQEAVRWERLLQALRALMNRHKVVKAAWCRGRAPSQSDEAPDAIDLVVVIASSAPGLASAVPSARARSAVPSARGPGVLTAARGPGVMAAAKGKGGITSPLDKRIGPAARAALAEIEKSLGELDESLFIRSRMTVLSIEQLAALAADERWWGELMADSHPLKGGDPALLAARARPAVQTSLFGAAG